MNMIDKEVRSTNLLDFILAILGTLFLVGGYIVLRFGFGLDPIKAELTSEKKTIIYIVSVSFSILFILLIENIQRWTKLLITHNGNKLYNKKYKDGFPINEDNAGYKLVEANVVINETSDYIERYNDMERFEEVVYYINMESRQKAYNRLLRGFHKKLNKRYKKAKKRRLKDELEGIITELNLNRHMIGTTTKMLVSINEKDKNNVEQYDRVLYEDLDIEPIELEPQILLDNEFNGYESTLDRIRSSRTYYTITTWILPIVLGVSFIVIGFMYEWDFQDFLSKSDKVILNLLVIYLVTKVPTTIYKAITNYRSQTLRPKLQASYVFKKYKIERDKVMEEGEEVR